MEKERRHRSKEEERERRVGSMAGSKEADRKEKNEEQRLIQQLRGQSYSKLKSRLRPRNWSCRHKREQRKHRRHRQHS